MRNEDLTRTPAPPHEIIKGKDLSTDHKTKEECDQERRVGTWILDERYLASNKITNVSIFSTSTDRNNRLLFECLTVLQCNHFLCTSDS